MRSYLIFGLILLFAAPLACEAQSAATLTRLQKIMALTPDPKNGEQIYNEHCSTCHERSGWGDETRRTPMLAGQQSLYLLEQLVQFSVQDRTHQAMHRVVSKPEIASPQTLRDVADYMSRQPLNPNPEHGPPRRVEGRRAGLLANLRDLSWRGPAPAAKEDLIPAIGGQRYGYLLVRLREFKHEHSPASWSRQWPTYWVVCHLPSCQSVAAYTSSLPALRAR